MVRALENKFNRQDEIFEIEDEQQPSNQIEEIAVRAVKLAGLSVRLGDYEFVSTSVRLLEPFIKAWYAKAGVEPPSTATISRWFYDSPPKWAIALLVNEKEKIFEKVMRKCKIP